MQPRTEINFIENISSNLHRSTIPWGSATSENSSVEDSSEGSEISPISKGIWSLLRDFLNNSSLHGLRYIGENRRHWFERLFWIVTFCISVVGSYFMINEIYSNWQLAPTITTLAEKPMSIWKIPFPAVTICPANKASKDQINYFKVLTFLQGDTSIKNASEYELKAYEAISQVCLVESHLKANSGLQPEEIYPLIKKVAVLFKYIKRKCKHPSELLHSDCESFFTNVMTEEGLCFTFNMIESSQLLRENVWTEYYEDRISNVSSNLWSLEKGFSSNEPNVYPNRVRGIGSENGLEMILDSDYEYFNCGDFDGYRVYLHAPNDFPWRSQNYVKVSMEKHVSVRIKPSMTTSSESLRNYRPQQRSCYFDGERYLKFFKIYTESNCKFECLTNFTLQACDCVKFSMPREATTKVCDQSKIACWLKARKQFLQDELAEEFDKISGENKGEAPCNCLLSCTTITYEAISTHESIRIDQYRQNILTFFFTETEIVVTNRSQRFGLTDFIANCGGILGLFLGFSISSLIETIYYFTFRLACNLKKKFKQTKFEA